MWIDDLTILPKLVTKTHFAIIVLPKGYGIDQVAKDLKGKNTFSLQPDPEKGSISIDQVRDLRELCRNKQRSRLTVVIESAEKMTESAANAFLKLLEEPNKNIGLLFITEDISRLLPTIRSRAQLYRVRPISAEQSAELLAKLAPKIDVAKKQQILFLATGLPGEIRRLATDKRYFTATLSKVGAAKILVQGPPIEKINWLLNYKAAKEAKETRARLAEILDLAAKLYWASFAKTKNPDILDKVAGLETARTQILQQNANYKLALMASVI